MESVSERRTQTKSANREHKLECKCECERRVQVRIESAIASRKGTMAERKFTRGLCKPGMAAQVRENVSQAVKATATQVKHPFYFSVFSCDNKVLFPEIIMNLLYYMNMYCIICAVGDPRNSTGLGRSFIGRISVNSNREAIFPIGHSRIRGNRDQPPA
ncbi:hypothetical protein E2C01_032771 [Portunus trituberculatus]|uniref:Uncharacterized protein n=1 Tax=Portunus trituberculatus TaxID=210409 RepID=A0A5B7EWS4_PORTR|nr:hypothetical protein [Portunus trituberculatus]